MLSLFVSSAVWAFDREIHYELLSASAASAPRIVDNAILFAYEGETWTRAVGITFAHEDYRHIHPFARNPQGLFVFQYPIPEEMDEIRYRLVVDGVWTIDPKAPMVRDHRGITVSTTSLPPSAKGPRPGVTPLDDGRYRFVLREIPGRRISLTGDFNKWDPYITEMSESFVEPGVYSVTVSIPPGKPIRYRFVVDGIPILDPEGFQVARNPWGESVSLFIP